MKITNRDKLYNSLIFVFLLFLSFVIVMNSPLNCLSTSEPSVDSSVFKYIAYAMSKGQMPYKDIFDHKGPLLYLINYLSLYISFWRGIWVVEFFFMLATVLCLFKILRLFCKRITSAIVLLIFVTPLFEFFGGGGI